MNDIGIKYLNLGASLISKNCQEASRYIKWGLIMNPEEPIGWYNAGISFHVQKKINSAILCYKKSLELKEELSEAKENLAQDYLLLGDYKKGLEMYEERMGKFNKDFQYYNMMFGEPWKGLDDKREIQRLVIVTEQGFGDTIQFCRFVKDVEKLGIEATLFCEVQLYELLKNSTSIKSLTTTLENTNQQTLWCPLMSLPYKLGIYDINAFNKGIYIKPTQDKIDKWKRRLKNSNSKFVVGIHWQGNKDYEQTIYSKGRSIPFKEFNDLAGIKNVEYLSLQKGPEKVNRKHLTSLKFISGNDIFENTLNFEDTAGAIANCDLIVTSDSCIAHLAGAMGIKPWFFSPTFLSGDGA